MNLIYAPLLICAVYSLVNSFIPDKDEKMSDWQLIISGIICVIGDASGVFALGAMLWKI